MMTTVQSARSRLASELRDDPEFDTGDVLEVGQQDLIDAEATARIGAAPYERTDTRANQRNGTR